MNEKTKTALSRSSVAEWKSENQKLTNSTTEAAKINNSRRKLLESTKLSRLPALPKRSSFYTNSPLQRPTGKADSCVKCGIELNEDNQKTSANVCTKCLSEYALIDIEINRTAENKARNAWLNKIGGDK